MLDEVQDSFACFGSTCAVLVSGPGAQRTARAAVELARARLLDWHDRFSRFEPGSEISRLNADPRRTVPVTWEMARIAAAIVEAARYSGGLVDATLLAEIGAAGYTADLPAGIGLTAALAQAPERRPGRAHPAARWRQIEVDLEALTVTRPPGCQVDAGGIAKGLFADLLADELASHAAFAVDCAGDLRVGGTAGLRRPVLVASPFEDRTLHRFDCAGGGIATSGIGRRSWLAADGTPAHHLLDPSTGRPAYTGVVQVTALAPTATEAEVRTKAALLAGPQRAAGWLPDGGVIVHDDGRAEIVTP